MIRKLIQLFELLFGCHHLLCWARSSAHSSTGLYRVCVRCGREFEVDAETWKPTGKRHAAPVYVPFDGTSRGWVSTHKFFGSLRPSGVITFERSSYTWPGNPRQG